MNDNFVEIEIEGRKIGRGQPAFIIAEMSANHNKDFDEAVKIIKAAKECGGGCHQVADLHSRYLDLRLR